MRTTLIASQAGAGYYPENTVYAMRQSLAEQIKPDGIEMDLHLTADGHFVAHHDYRLHPDLTRDAKGTWLTETGATIKHSDLEQLSQYNFGGINPTSKLAKRYPQRQTIDDEKIARFGAISEVLLETDHQMVEYWFEAKTNPYDTRQSHKTEFYADALINLLSKHPLKPRIVLIAFDWPLLQRVQAALPELQTGYLSIDFKWMSKNPVRAEDYDLWFGEFNPKFFNNDFGAAVKAAGGDYWSPYFRDINAASVKNAQNTGIKVSTWGADSISELESIKAFGVDSLTTAYVDRARTIFDPR